MYAQKSGVKGLQNMNNNRDRRQGQTTDERVDEKYSIAHLVIPFLHWKRMGDGQPIPMDLEVCRFTGWQSVKLGQTDKEKAHTTPGRAESSTRLPTRHTA